MQKQKNFLPIKQKVKKTKNLQHRGEKKRTVDVVLVQVSTGNLHMGL